MGNLSAGYKLAERLKSLPLYQLERKGESNIPLAEVIFIEILKIFNSLDFTKKVSYLGPLVLGDQLKVALKESVGAPEVQAKIEDSIQKINNLI